MSNLYADSYSRAVRYSRQKLWLKPSIDANNYTANVPHFNWATAPSVEALRAAKLGDAKEAMRLHAKASWEHRRHNKNYLRLIGVHGEIGSSGDNDDALLKSAKLHEIAADKHDLASILLEHDTDYLKNHHRDLGDDVINTSEELANNPDSVEARMAHIKALDEIGEKGLSVYHKAALGLPLD